MSGWSTGTIFFFLLFLFGTPAIAAAKNRPWGNWLIAGFLLGPIAFLIVIFTPRLQPEAARRCPWCKGGVRADAIVCMHCARDMRDVPPALDALAATGNQMLCKHHFASCEGAAGNTEMRCTYCGVAAAPVW
jgi:hypothetical protein